MNIYIYSDESGTLDKKHNKFYSYGGLIVLGDRENDRLIAQYRRTENEIREKYNISQSQEIKASGKDNDEIRRIVLSKLQDCYSFGVVINETQVYDKIFESKKSKQRFLDHAYKMGIKHALQQLISLGLIDPQETSNIFFYPDNHTTATNGLYELKESLEKELKHGMYNSDFTRFVEPILPNINVLQVQYRDSKLKRSYLVRGADFIANDLLRQAYKGVNYDLPKTRFLILLPNKRVIQ